MNITLTVVKKMLAAIEAPEYDIGVLSDRGMLPGLSNLPHDAVLSRLPLLRAQNARGAHIYVRPSGSHRYTALDDLQRCSVERLISDGFEPCAVIETSPANFQAWLKHSEVLSKELSTFAAQTLARRYGADPSAADWRRFGRLPGFTNCKEKHRRQDGLFPFVHLRTCSGEPFQHAEHFRLDVTQQYELQRQQREATLLEQRTRPGMSQDAARYAHLSIDRFRNASKYRDRPAAADMAFCVAAYSLAMPEAAIASTLSTAYLSRDPNPRRKSAYIKRTLQKAKSWAEH